MKKILSLIFFLTTLAAGAQNSLIEAVLKEPESKDEVYLLSLSGSKALFLPMEYGKSDFTFNQLAAINELKDAIVAGVDLVYSDYPSKADFTALNRKRLSSLYKILPGIFEKGNVQFRKIRQTWATNKTEASYLPHGFYIYYRPIPGKTTAKAELKKLDKLLGTKSGPAGSEKEADTTIKYCSEFSFYTDTVTYMHPLREGFSRSITRISKADGLKSKLIDSAIYGDYLKGYDSAYYVLDVNKEGCDSWDGVYNYDAIDSTVSEVFKRHAWKNAMVIADVTGSMYPYSAQLLLWLQLTLTDNQRRSFVFFNDGDNKEDAAKVIGKTGGIYTITTSKYEEVKQKIEEAMTNGGGGDAPENNIEALLAADKLCGACDSVVMIADNWAPVKDISLLSSVTKPIKIVLCGVYGPVNADYLNMARKTKGSLHLMEKDIYELTKLKEGEVIEIAGIKYKITGGEFKIVKKTSI